MELRNQTWLVAAAGCNKADLDNWRRHGFLGFLPLSETEAGTKRYSVAHAVALRLFSVGRYRLGVDRSTLAEIVSTAFPQLERACNLPAGEEGSISPAAGSENGNIYLAVLMLANRVGVSVYVGTWAQVSHVYNNRRVQGGQQVPEACFLLDATAAYQAVVAHSTARGVELVEG